MIGRRSVAAFTIAMLAACADAPRVESTQNAPRPFAYMDELRKAEDAAAGALVSADPGDDTARAKRSMSLQILATAQSMVGDSSRAAETTARAFGSQPLTHESRLAAQREAEELLSGHDAQAALAVIVREARDRQIVILNEAHTVARHRAFGLRVALELRKLGFEYLAMEALSSRGDTANLAARRYPVASDGHYINEPFFGDFIRQALAAGYTPIAYERKYDASFAALDMFDKVSGREETQAQNIVDRVLAKDPRARILVFVGHGHVVKGTVDMDGRSQRWMAERLRQKAGVEPLCIDQTQTGGQRDVERDRLLAERVFAVLDTDAFVLESKATDRTYWPAGGVDIRVWHRPERLEDGRPHWMSMDGYRAPRPIPVELLPQQGRRLVQAFVEGESEDAVPMDQVLVTAGEKPPVFMLPKGKYRFAVQE
jgi:hypothetical protein